MTHVIDASVLLAHFLDEPGGEVLLDRSCLFHLSVVNLAEVFTKAVERGAMTADVETCVERLPIRVRAFRDADGVKQALLRTQTRAYGLSFGDRVCLALAQVEQLPVLTADRKWAELDLDLDIRLIR